ncbi:MAG: CDP-glycerol glycerophosphotransferase family protein [Clostridia bacterium]|nr:CDP-glycerol glycerophosphotransferase family protein [Clostridia bacterium]
MYKIKRVFIYVKVFMITVIAEIAGIFARRKKDYKDLWIISERGVDARDNGYHFFKFLRKEHPEINSVYIITKNSPDKEKVASLGKTVDYGSFRHYLCFLLAKVKVSTHVDGYSPDILFFNKFGRLFPERAKKVFLQHGIIKNDLSFCHADHAKLDLFCCSAVPEYEFIGKTFGHKEGVLQLTGLCRYDNLKRNEVPTRKILFMPTWRWELRTCTKNTFLKSEYFEKFNSFLCSRKLSELLDEFDYELIFYPHYEIQRFIDCFATDIKRVRIADFKNSDVQDLLINTDVLITDYSSVFFDYAYMRKPMVYFQYDDIRVRREVFEKGYFDHERDGFGAVVMTEDEVVESLRHILENDLHPDDVYLDRMNAFFMFNDTKNCQRVFEKIKSLFGK